MELAPSGRQIRSRPRFCRWGLDRTISAGLIGDGQSHRRIRIPLYQGRVPAAENSHWKCIRACNCRSEDCGVGNRLARAESIGGRELCCKATVIVHELVQNPVGEPVCRRLVT